MTTNVPFRTNEQIWAAVEEFRLVDGVAPYLGPPVDAVSIAEIVFSLTPVPFPDLLTKYKYDAALVPGLTDILIDEAAYLGLDKSNPWHEQRLRFSVAHELGHRFMHRGEIEENQFSSFIDFKRWTMDPSVALGAEYQADEFAGRLLVPRENLLYWYDHHLQDVVQKRPDWRQHPAIRSHLAKIIAPRFGVTRKVIETRFDREGIWPAE